MSATPLSRRTAIEWVLSIGGIAIVLTMILTLDARVRGYAAAAFSEQGSGPHAAQGVLRVARTAWDLCRDHEPLAVFAGIACLLILFMKQVR